MKLNADNYSVILMNALVAIATVAVVVTSASH
jgi:hypothetical protein